MIGVVIAAIVLLPEGLAALRAARADRLQTSLNLALGSALASIGLTISAVAIVALATGWTLVLGLDLKAMVLLTLTLLVATLSLGTRHGCRAPPSRIFAVYCSPPAQMGMLKVALGRVLQKSLKSPCAPKRSASARGRP